MELMKEDYEALIARIVELEGQVDKLTARCHAVESATFWKISEPLRRVLASDHVLLARFRALMNRLARGETSAARQGALTSQIKSVIGTDRQPPIDAPPGARSTYLFVEFIWNETASPEALGLNNDSRQLAAGFQRIAFRPAENADAPSWAEIDFRIGGNAMRHICYGYSYVESWGCWSTGGRSCVVAWLPEAAAGCCEIEVSAAPFTEAFQTVSAQVLVNGKAAGELSLNGEAPASIRIDIAEAAPVSNERDLNLSLDADRTPEVSIVILNYNKPGITLACVRAILAARTDKTFEIIVADNGGSHLNYLQLKEMNLPVRLVRLRANRFFGEGNNIAAEYARATVVIFLNNDAFVTDHTIDALSNALLASDEVGATGPVFVYPDGSIQEAGAFLRTDATAYQRGKGDKTFDVGALKAIEVVDYVSAACVALRRDDFYALGGFDLRYEPAYYEDSDLCLRLMALGKKTVLVRDAKVVHIENATTSDPRNRGIANDVVERHRQVFLSRWGEWLARRQGDRLPHIETFPISGVGPGAGDFGAQPANCVYTPFSLIPGGGERYLLATAVALSEQLPTLVSTPDEYSVLRLRSVLRELGLPDRGLAPEVERRLAARDIQTYFLMGNELAPTRPGVGERRFYHCQFPFPTALSSEDARSHADNLRNFDAVIVNSEFTREAYARQGQAAGLAQKPIIVLPPPVRLLTRPQGPAVGKENLIISVGRFTPLGHAKRQDVIVEAFIKARKAGLRGWRLVLCGQVPNEPSAIAYFEALKALCADAKVEIVLAPSRQQLEELLWRSKLYVSATGFGAAGPEEDWKCEHFGISVVEAASAGCLPVVYERGGPVEVTDHLDAKFRFGSINGLATAMAQAAEAASEIGLADRIIERSAFYSEEKFFARWAEMLAVRGDVG